MAPFFLLILLQQRIHAMVHRVIMVEVYVEIKTIQVAQTNYALCRHSIVSAIATCGEVDVMSQQWAYSI